LESKAFLLGFWKNYEELEESISIPELVAILEAKSKEEYDTKKFFAAIQGVDIDQNNSSESQKAWERMKAKAFSKGKTTDPDDIVSLSGTAAKKAGFGIGEGLDYEVID
jgi:uncharacterized UPF0160 family protein